MKPSEIHNLPEDAQSRPHFPTLAEALTPLPSEPFREHVGPREIDYEPRFVAPSAPRHDASGTRNLAFGGGALFLALLIGGAALFIVGPRAILPLVACLFTFCILYLLARLQIFREQHGAFLALGVVCLIGAVFALFERAFHGLDGNYFSQLTAPPAPTRYLSANPPAEPGPTLLAEAFALTAPDPKSGPRVKARKDSRVVIEGKPFLIKSGDIFPLAEAKADEVTFKVRDLHIALPLTAVEILDASRKEKLAEATPVQKPAEKPAPEPAPVGDEGPSPAVAAEVTRQAQGMAIRRYPALAMKDSRENAIFVSTVTEMKASKNTEFFKNPEWPLELAELLAKREGWPRDDVPLKAPPLPPPAPNAEPQLPVLEN